MCASRILRGTRPGELAIEAPSKYEFVVNARTAEALGVRLPVGLRARVDRVVE